MAQQTDPKAVLPRPAEASPAEDGPAQASGSALPCGTAFRSRHDQRLMGSAFGIRSDDLLSPSHVPALRGPQPPGIGSRITRFMRRLWHRQDAGGH